METIDFSKSCVYGFMKENKFYYIGSSRNLTKRFNSHKSHCNNEKDRDYNFSLYNYMRENGGFDAWKIVVICEYPECKSEEELVLYERQYCDKYNPILNKKRPQITEDERTAYKEQYNEKNRYVLNEKAKVYYAENKDKYKQYREENAEAIQEKQSSPEAKIKQKEYREDNKEKMKIYQQQKREENSTKNKEKHTCQCGGQYSHRTA